MSFYCNIIRLILINLLIVSTVAYANIFPERQNIDRGLEKLGVANRFDETKTIDWGLLPGPFYTPEMSAGVGVALVGLYRIDKNDKNDKNDKISQPSSIESKWICFSDWRFRAKF